MTYSLLLLGLVLLFFIFLWAKEKPDQVFWVVIILILDPGGYLNKYFGSLLPGYLTIIDFIIPLLIFPLLSSKITLISYFQDKKVKTLVWYLIFISIYLIIFYGFVIPKNDLETWARFIYISRYQIFSPLLIIPSYIFARRSIQLHYKYTIKVAVVVLSFYILTFLIDISFVPILVMERFKNSEYFRYILPGNGHMTFLILISVIWVITKIHLPYKKQFLYSGFVMFLALLLSLTRGVIIEMVVQIVVCIFLTIKVFKTHYLQGFWKYFLYLLFFSIVMAFALPKQTMWLKEVFSLTYKELTGEVKEGTTQSRTLYEIPRQLALFKKNPVVGVGYRPELTKGALTGDSIDATDTPYIASWAMYGIVGTSFFLFLYWIILNEILTHLKLCNIYTCNKFSIIYFIIISSIFIAGLVFPNGIFSEYIKKTTLLANCIIWGILYAVMSNIRSSINED